MGNKKCRTLEPTKQFFICTEKAYHEIKNGLSNSLPLAECPVCGVKIDYKKLPILSDLYDKSIRKPEVNPLYKDFFEKFIENLSKDRCIPVEILKKKFSPEWINYKGKMLSPERPSINPVKEKEPPEIIKCSQCGCIWPAGHNYCPECAKPLLNDDESIDPDTKCAECDHPDECEICLSAFEASRTRKEIAVTARIFSANVKLEEENAALKKLFIAEHREKNDLLKSLALHRGREKDLLNKTEELNNQISFRITSFDKIDSIIKGILQKRIGLCPPSKELLLMREICEEGITYGRK